MTDLVEQYDAVLFDLDGVVYLGPEPVLGAAEGIAALRQRGIPVSFVTNNAARAPEAVADHLMSLGIPCTPQEVTTAGQAGVRMLTQQLPAGATVLVCGSPALTQQVRAAGFRITDSADHRPDAIIQGYYPELSWPTLTEAALAVQRGARWFATNVDPTRPTDRGLEPGAGAQIAVVRVVVGGDPMAAGKPEKPLMEAAMARLSAQRPIFIGDRLDTDIAGGVNAGIDTMLVFSGIHQAADLFDAIPAQRPDQIGWDLRDLLSPAHIVERDGDGARCAGAYVRSVDGAVRIETAGEELDLIWATARLVWDVRDAGGIVDPEPVLRALRGATDR